jgi:hypothetical protein
MQLVANGPDLPNALLQAHEEGHVVFFCGAGISYPAGLPNFGGLVDEIYKRVGTTPSPIEEEAYKNKQFDATLGLLEHRLVGQRLEVRRAVADALQPKLGNAGATDNHKALLQLARGRDGAVRLVTTNFDRVFAGLTVCPETRVSTHIAPMLPIPKNSRWNGLVYLHGLLPEDYDEDALNRLVFTSGDFGLAYLTERWAARFVSELLRNYMVCFVGYSINDHVLRYMMNAMTADRMRGEVVRQAYAFGECAPGEESKSNTEWEAKGVVPILYRAPIGIPPNHSCLYSTLSAWADTYRDGILGRERMVVDCAKAHPSASTRQDDFVGRMLWALSDDSGLPAKRFAEIDPVPPLDWLEALSENRYCCSDLVHFGVPSHAGVDEKLEFSQIRRPSPHTLAPWMNLVSSGPTHGQWDKVMFQLARWLVRHLNDPKLIVWIADHGGQLHDQLAFLVADRLNTIVRLERERNTDELARIREQASNAIPGPHMRILWRLLLTGRATSPRQSWGLYRWKNRLDSNGLTATLRFEMRELLAPKVALRESSSQGGDDRKDDAPKQLRQLVDWELVLTVSRVHDFLRIVKTSDCWCEALPELVDDFQQLLHDALDLSRELDGANDHRDRSWQDLPSISQHPQNRGFRDWVALIELLRDAWLAVQALDPVRATRIAQAWYEVPYPTFKRMALYAASKDGCIASEEWVEWLIATDAWCLWSFQTMRETLRVIVLQGRQLTAQAQNRLEAAILDGPPRTMLPSDMDPERWKSIADHAVWLRLAKLKSSGISLGVVAAERLDLLSIENQKRHPAANQRDEFPCWISVTGDHDVEDDREVDIVPRGQRELIAWLKRSEASQRPLPEHEDGWHEACRIRPFRCGFALCKLAQEDEWPAGRWSGALYAWSRKRLVQRLWRHVAPIVKAMPDHVLKDIAHSISDWLEEVSKSLTHHEDIFLRLCQRILDVSERDGLDADEPVTQAINHPVGHLTQALLNLWFRQKLNDGDRLPANLEPIFTRISDVGMVQFRHGRVLLAAHLIVLFRVDQPWTEEHLLPLFNWKSSDVEACAAWAGFMWSPRLYRPLLIAFKEQLLDTASRYTQLSESAQQYAAFLTFVALERVEHYTTQELRTAFGALTLQGLSDSARVLVQALDGAGEQREDYWANRIQPFLHDIWPKDRDKVSSSIAESFARLSIVSRDMFPNALHAVEEWLQGKTIEYPDYVVEQLCETELSTKFPSDALALLDAVIDDQPSVPDKLNECLTAIAHAEPELSQDGRYKQLVEYSRRHGA